MNKKLLNKDLKVYRELLLKEQNGLCLLCELPIPKGKAVLDHQHQSSRVRGVLCNACNRSESVVNTFKRYGLKEEAIPTFLSNLSAYWSTDYSNNLIHPKHVHNASEIDRLIVVTRKEIKRLTKAQGKLKTTEAKQRYQDKIETLSQRLKELNIQLKEENQELAWKEGDSLK